MSEELGKEFLENLFKDLGIPLQGEDSSESIFNDVVFINVLNNESMRAIQHIHPVRVAEILVKFAKNYEISINKTVKLAQRHNQN